MAEWIGVAMAVLSSALGGSAAAVTRFLAGDADPLALALIRFGFGFLIVLPIAAAGRNRWPPLRDWPAVAGLGILFFALAIVLYNLAVSLTTAARASLALSTLPLLTMLVGAALGLEALSRRKTVGVLVAMLGVAIALAAGVQAAPPGAWRGEVVMLGTSLIMAFYNVWSRPFIERSSALGVLTVGMGAAAIALALAAGLTGSVRAIGNFDAGAWIAALYLAAGGGALAFILWIMALARTTPTRVAVTMTVNPIAAALLARALLEEPITVSFLAGLVTVFAGIWIAAYDPPATRRRATRKG